MLNAKTEETWAKHNICGWQSICFTLIIIICLWQTEVVEAQNEVYKTDNGYVEFKSEVPSHTFTGESDKVIGKISLADSTIDFYVDLATLKTGISLRDQDMYETLNIEEHPFAEFFGKLDSSVNPDTSVQQRVVADGEFSIHGVAREVRIPGYLRFEDGNLNLTANWVIKLSDYNIEPPGILFYRVDEKQEITLQTELKPVEN